MDFYIRDENQQDGPYDLMGIIRKIRNGSITEDTLLAPSAFEEALPANQYPQLSDVFEEKKHRDADAANFSASPIYQRDLMSYLHSGIDLLRGNMAVSIYTAVFVVLWLVVAMMLTVNFSPIPMTIGIIAMYFIFGGYLYGLIRYVRGNPVDPAAILSRMMDTAVPMLVVSGVVAGLMLPVILITRYFIEGAMLTIGLPIVLSCLLFIMTFLAFTPMLILDKNKDFWDALSGSKKVIMQNNGQKLGIVFACLAINFLLLPLLPLTLPITMGALVDMFEEKFG